MRERGVNKEPQQTPASPGTGTEHPPLLQTSDDKRLIVIVTSDLSRRASSAKQLTVTC